MRALAEQGIDLVLASGEFSNDQVRKSDEEIKAEGIIRWLYQQNDYRNAIYYFNELARRYLDQGRLKMVENLFQEFKAWTILNSNVEIEAYEEERSKIKRLVALIRTARDLKLGGNGIESRIEKIQGLNPKER